MTHDAAQPETGLGPGAVPDFGLCVLASGSAGNCSVLRVGDRLILIDAGLSPRRTRRAIADLGLASVPIAAVVLTHLDDDHYHAGWPSALGAETTVYMHRSHAGRARREGRLPRRADVFAEPFEPVPGLVFAPTLIAHDSLGAAAFRVELGGVPTLGFATDIGRVSETLVAGLRGVDVLAIESNYCPRLQLASSRPDFLKRRIMGGSGHLSNEQCRDAVAAIAPRRHVVLLHLSRECNAPELAAAHHAGAPYRLTITSQLRASEWIALSHGPRATVRPSGPTPRPLASRPRLVIAEPTPMLWSDDPSPAQT